MDLKTTTRPNRHTAQFREVRALLAPPADGRPLEVANIGPGLAVKYFGRLAEETVPGWDIVKRIESGIRRIPMPDACFENYETHELVRMLEGLPFRLTVIDINPKVVRIVARSMPDRSVETVVADLGAERPASLLPLYGKFDLVVAFTVIGRVKTRLFENARQHHRPGETRRHPSRDRRLRRGRLRPHIPTFDHSSQIAGLAMHALVLREAADTLDREAGLIVHSHQAIRALSLGATCSNGSKNEDRDSRAWSCREGHGAPVWRPIRSGDRR